MLFLGGGWRVKTFPIPDRGLAACKYDVIRVMFIFSVAIRPRWYASPPVSPGAVGSVVSAGVADAPPFQTSTGMQPPPPGAPPPPPTEPSPIPERPDLVPIDKADLEARFNPQPLPKAISFWEQYSLGLLVVTLVALVGISAWVTRGTTSVSAVDVGTCFNSTDEFEVTQLDTPGCDQPHDSQVVLILELDADEQNPDLLDGQRSEDFWDGVIDRCLNEGGRQVTRVNELPDDTEIHILTPTPESWEAGDRDVICYLYRPGGLEGSFVAGG